MLEVPFKNLFDVFTNGTDGPQRYQEAVSYCTDSDENRKGGKGKKKKGGKNKKKGKKPKPCPTFEEALEIFECMRSFICVSFLNWVLLQFLHV